MRQKIQSIISAFFVALALHQMAPVAAADTVPKRVADWVDAYEDFDLNRFLNFYAENVTFKDPTAGIDFPNKQALTDAYTNIMQGRWGGDFRMDINSVVESGDTVVMEGIFSLSFNGEVAKMNFTTWLDFEGGLIVRQLDLFNYAALRRQIPTYGQGLPAEYTGPRD